MALLTPTWLQNGTYSARLDRIFADVMFTEGVMRVAAGQLLVTQRGAGANNSVDIAAGYACITGDDSADQGNYLVRNDGVVNLAATAAPVSNSRIDLVCLRVNDTAAGGPAGDNATFVYVTGTAAASPVPPATPTSAIVLARVLRTVGDTSVVTANITDQRTQSLTFFSNTLTNAGDLLSFDGTNLTRIGLGTLGQPLVAGATSVGYGQVSSAGIAANAVDTTQIANSAVTTGKIATNAVDGSKIAAGAVTNDKFGTAAGQWGGARATQAVTLSNITLGGATSVARSLIVGKTLFLTWYLTGGAPTATASAATTVTVTGITSAAQPQVVVYQGPLGTPAYARLAAGSNVITLYSGMNQTNYTAGASISGISLTGVFELA